MRTLPPRPRPPRADRALRVAVVDRDEESRRVVQQILSQHGYDVVVHRRGRDLLGAVAELDAVCLDLALGDELEGMELLSRLVLANAELPVIVVTVDPSAGAAVKAIKAGAYDYLTKPIGADLLLHTVRRACERYTLVRQVRELEETTPFGAIVGDSAPMLELARQVERVLQSDATVCLFGESGTGKELVARAIHEHGHRSGGPFVALNCAAIPTSLQESELFGHERGAFTGAQQARRGRFEEAHEGTLFLDEVGEMGLETQAVLLRTLQDKKVRRVGANKEIPVDVRIVCATHRKLRALVESGRFRQDLYYRLVVYPVELPPLRRRRDDIPALVAHFIRELQSDIEHRVNSIRPEALDALMQHAWPGNVRELRNVVHRAMLSSRGEEIELRDLPTEVRSDLKSLPPPSMYPQRLTDDDEVVTLEELERRAILKAMRVAGGRIGEAAKLLGIGRATLYRRVAKLEIDAPTDRD